MRAVYDVNVTSPVLVMTAGNRGTKAASEVPFSRIDRPASARHTQGGGQGTPGRPSRPDCGRGIATAAKWAVSPPGGRGVTPCDVTALDRG